MPQDTRIMLRLSSRLHILAKMQARADKITLSEFIRTSMEERLPKSAEPISSKTTDNVATSEQN
jgi:hypothetical protein